MKNRIKIVMLSIIGIFIVTRAYSLDIESIEGDYQLLKYSLATIPPDTTKNYQVYMGYWDFSIKKSIADTFDIYIYNIYARDPEINLGANFINDSVFTIKKQLFKSSDGRSFTCYGEGKIMKDSIYLFCTSEYPGLTYHDTYRGFKKNKLLYKLEGRCWEETEYHIDLLNPNKKAIVNLRYCIPYDASKRINGVEYKRLMRECLYQDSINNQLLYKNSNEFVYFIRENEYGQFFIKNSALEKEILLYDFSDWNPGDTIYFGYNTDNFKDSLKVEISKNNLDSIELLDGSFAKSISFNNPNGIFDKGKIINGIGYEYGFFYLKELHPESYSGGIISRYYKKYKLSWINPEYSSLQNPNIEKDIKYHVNRDEVSFKITNNAHSIELITIDGKPFKFGLVSDYGQTKFNNIQTGIYICIIKDRKGAIIATGKVFVGKW